MAQTLIEDSSYKLKTSEETVHKRQVYFVKLTDSCLKALEEHIAYQAATRTKPSIKFNGLNGVLTIPTKPSSVSQDIGKKFNFAVSNLAKPSINQGILECIKHTDRSTKNLVSYGPLESRISIAASEDVYENTRNRMAQVDQERKDVRTREIEVGGMKKRKQSKAKVSHDTSYNKLAAMKKKIKTNSSNSPKLSTPPTTIRHASPVSTSNRSSPATVGKSFTCRERVIHILALRPYKKPELISRLQREAMSPKDRNNLAMVLQQVSALQDHQYKLHSHLYAEIQAGTWPFYTESERIVVKSNISTHKQLVNTPSPQMVTSTSKSPEDKTPVKRPHQLDSTSSHKRQKVNIENKYDEPSSTTAPVSNLNKPEPQSKIIANKIHSQPDKKKRKDVNTTKYGEESPPTVASTSDTPEYLTAYKPITSYEQRCQYKRDFQTEYPEYIELKKNVDTVTTKFIELDRSWRRTETGSEEYLRIQDEIVEAYQKQQKDEKYHEMKRRCEELHQKLSHIKKLVVEYDASLQT